MTNRLSLNALTRWAVQVLGNPGAARTEEQAPASSAPLSEDRVFLLSQMLQLEVIPARTREGFKLFSHQMSLKSVLFRGPRGLREGDAVEVRLLLRADRHLALSGKVIWIHQGPQGITGQLDLQAPPPEVAAEVLAYLEHKSR